jgi:hypothetical protein
MRESFLKGILLSFSCVWLILQWSRFEVPIDCGDGIMHFFISQASWHDPLLFLHHWGKPFFTLLSSPFSQFGLVGLVVFNVLIFALTVIFGWKILRKSNTPLLFQILFPFFLILTNDYTDTIIGGLTEPLFSFILVLSTWCFIQKNYLFFALLIGFLPFCRSEGQLLILLAVFLLIMKRQWKSISVVFIPFLIYAIIGFFVLDEFWWYFTQSPYSMDNAIYGSGTWSHYFISYKNYIGNHGLFSLALAFIVFVILLIKRGFNRFDWSLLLLFFTAFFTILFVHVYFWANGLNGSMGLTRITTQGLPSLLIGVFYVLGQINLKIPPSTKYQLVLSMVLIFFSINKFDLKPELSELDQAILNGVQFMKQNKINETKTLYHHPLFAYKMNFNSLLKIKQSQFYYHRGAISQLKSDLNYGAFVTWDSNFGPQEMNLPFDSLYLDSEFVLVNSNEITGVLSPTGFFIFQYVPPNFKNAAAPIRTEQVIFNQTLPASTDEFYPIYKKENNTKPLHLEVQFSASSDQLIVFATHKGKFYKTFSLQENKKIRYYFEREKEIVIYIWNQSKKPLENAEVSVIEFKEKVLPLFPNKE